MLTGSHAKNNTGGNTLFVAGGMVFIYDAAAAGGHVRVFDAVTGTAWSQRWILLADIGTV